MTTTRSDHIGQPADPARVGWSPARLAYGFYTVAATGAVIGQTWVALTHVPWPQAVPGLARVAAVLPFAICLELLAMALAAMADERMRLGERAYGFRAFSALVAIVAVGILVAGHWPHLYWSAAFGVLSASAYLLWLLHSAARRRDALRAAGKLADTAPDYGLWRRLRHPVWTARAAELARQGCQDTEGRWRPLGLFESLRAADLAIRADRRRPAIAAAVEQVVRADQRDPRMAEVAVRTLDLDRLAAELAARVDYHAWADRLAPAITAPAPAPPDRHDAVDTDLSARSEPASGEFADPAATASVVAAPTLPGSQPEPAAPAPAPSEDRHGTAVGAGVPVARTADCGDGREHQRDATGGCVAGPAPRLDVDRDGPVGEDRPGARGTGSVATTARGPRDGALVGENERGSGTRAPAVGPETGDDPGKPEQAAPDAPAREPGDRGGDGGVPADTAAAVAYWYRQDPSLHPADIAARIGRSERTVRRYWPPTSTRTVNGRAAAGLAEGLRAV
jgi:hypothetical protein